MGNLQNFTKKTLPTMAVAFVAATVKDLMGKDTVKSAIRGRVRKFFTGTSERPYRPVPVVEEYSDKIMRVLGEKNIHPQTIAIDGPPGSGKSTLGRSLANRTGLKWHSLNLKDMHEPYFFLPGRIYENIRLIRTQDIEKFDIIIYIDCRAEDAQHRVIERDRNGALADYLDFKKLKKIGDAAFEMAVGEEITIPLSPVRIKIRPKDGYRDIDNLRMILQSRGLDIADFSKEELLFTYCYGKPKSGIVPYVKFGAYNKEILSGAMAALRAVSAKKMLS